MIDVIMPTYNRAASLRTVADSYFAQPELGKFIIVDDCSTDDTPALALELSAAHPGKVVYERLAQKTTLPDLRNIGIGLAMNDYIFMGEDDVIVPPDHFAVLLRDMQELGAAIIAGRRIYLHEGESFGEAREQADKDTGPLFVRIPFEGYFERRVDRAQRVPYIHSNSLMRRKIFETVRYDPWYGGNAFREELDFYLRAHNAGFPIYLVPDTLSYHLRNTPANKKGGSRKKRLVYEFQVWRNTVHCFAKNAAILRTEFGVRNVPLFTMQCLVARYSYATQRRLRWLTHGTSSKT